LLQQLSLSLRYLVSLYTALWYRDSIVTLSIPATTQEAVTQPLPLLPRLHCRPMFLQPRRSPQTLIEYNDGHKKDGSKMQVNRADKIKGSSGKENHQGRGTREVGIEIPLPLQKAMSLIPVTMDPTRVVEEGEEVTQAGDQREETLLTHKSQ